MPGAPVLVSRGGGVAIARLPVLDGRRPGRSLTEGRAAVLAVKQRPAFGR
jgi:hypothetical protein